MRRRVCGDAVSLQLPIMKRVLWLLLTLSFFLGAASSSTAVKDTAPFRCMRPFGSLPRFSPANMDAAENCKFGLLRVINATARTRCVRDDAARGASTASNNDKMPPTCSVTLNVTFQAEGNEAYHAVGVSSVAGHEEAFGGEAYRFSLRLRAFNDSVVEYKGFDQNGYSMCCNFIQSAECSWDEERKSSGTPHYSASPQEDNGGNAPDASRRREAMVVSCPIHSQVVPGGVFHGVITKPLHRLVVTEWEARLEFWRGQRQERVMLGRVLLPFRLTEDDIASAYTSDAAATTLTATAVAAIDDSTSGGRAGAAPIETGDVIGKRKGSGDL
ncbi:hypothetical protein TraAM80_02717 [Trypanosoma rangeli]|uniref:Uncharacterized protein n=1 Tax=Trypanosoma rangeli TaxID=5698 RepID=A0A3R7KKV6_TRYRA|nr:uncharacterized protein TraAM80_02717 [Trypanosoma rangeli]RNF08491.1 hypothetical protein TraAM80_02717 [Trypanosoma rangeli]|eukprot:RNF08491.1 hypothetical protein TraAM80_02717 [Trypanosoma rangeli]